MMSVKRIVYYRAGRGVFLLLSGALSERRRQRQPLDLK